MAEDRWEYRGENLGGLFRSVMIERRVETLLNKLSAEGWELASHDRSWLTHRFTLMLRRPASGGRLLRPT
jgi:hypothetical protein